MASQGGNWYAGLMEPDPKASAKFTDLALASGEKWGAPEEQSQVGLGNCLLSHGMSVGSIELWFSLPSLSFITRSFQQSSSSLVEFLLPYNWIVELAEKSMDFFLYVFFLHTNMLSFWCFPLCLKCSFSPWIPKYPFFLLPFDCYSILLHLSEIFTVFKIDICKTVSHPHINCSFVAIVKCHDQKHLIEKKSLFWIIGSRWRVHNGRRNTAASGQSRKLSNHTQEVECEEEVEWGYKTSKPTLSDMTGFLQPSSFPKNSITFPNNTSTGEQVFKHLNLWGVFLIHTTTPSMTINSLGMLYESVPSQCSRLHQTQGLAHSKCSNHMFNKRIM